MAWLGTARTAPKARLRCSRSLIFTSVFDFTSFRQVLLCNWLHVLVPRSLSGCELPSDRAARGESSCWCVRSCPLACRMERFGCDVFLLHLRGGGGVWPCPHSRSRGLRAHAAWGQRLSTFPRAGSGCSAPRWRQEESHAWETAHKSVG